MKKSEIKQLIKEVLNSSNIDTEAPVNIEVNDYVQWVESENERGMYISKGTYIGKVIKVFDSKRIQVEVVFPSAKEGDMYKITKNEVRRIPSEGESISFKSNSSLFTGKLTGIITKVDIPNAKIIFKTQEGKSITISIRDRIWRVITKI